MPTRSAPSDPYAGTKSNERVYAWETVPIEESDRGANDEGYYYAYCYGCERRTEHENDECLECCY